MLLLTDLVVVVVSELGESRDVLLSNYDTVVQQVASALSATTTSQPNQISTRCRDIFAITRCGTVRIREYDCCVLGELLPLATS